MLNKIVLLICLLFLVGCNCNQQQQQRIDNIVKVFVSGSTDCPTYKALVEEGNELKYITLCSMDKNKIRLIKDVPEGKMMYAEWRGGMCDIHIHSSIDIEGGKTGGKYPSQLHEVAK